MVEEEINQEKQETKVFSVADAIKKLKKEKERKFNQTLELIVNLQKYDPRKQPINTFVILPNPTDKKICAFLSRKSPSVDSITETEFVKYKDAREVKRLAKKYDSFMAVAKLMPKVATQFGRVLGPQGKMPSPQGGIVPNDDEASIKKMLEKMSKSLRVTYW
jgi:large subunit ribosomal protein L1